MLCVAGRGWEQTEDMSRLHVFGTAQPSGLKGSAEIVLWPKLPSGDLASLALNHSRGIWSVIWVVHCHHLFVHKLKLTPLLLSNQLRSSGVKEGPVFLAHWLQAKLRKSHNVMILNVEPAFFCGCLV